MASDMQLVMTKVPSHELVFTNELFVHAETLLSLSAGQGICYVQIGKYIFCASAHDSIARGSLAISAVQRKLCKLTKGEKVPVSRWIPPPSSQLTLLALEVRRYGDKNVGRCEVSENDVVNLIRARLINQVFQPNQKFCVELDGNVLAIKVVETAGPDDFTGILSATTTIEVSPDPRAKGFIFIPSTSQMPTLFNKEIDLSDLGIGGLDVEFGIMFRRAFASRLSSPELIKRMGIKHVKGILLHGPPGTGKTLIARKIGHLLGGEDAPEPIIVNGPEVLDRFVGGSAKNIRMKFEPAMAEYKQRGSAARLHVIIFDEIDAICKQRGTTSDSGAGDSVVTQLLAMIDGVDSPPNVLVIGMTNRRDLLDTALTRPGRLEVKIEIGLPDEAGRQQILDIHTQTMRTNGLLADWDSAKLASITKNFSGAELEGLVKSASSFALSGAVDAVMAGETVKEDDVAMNMGHFMEAFRDVRPAFGVPEEELSSHISGGIVPWGEPARHVIATGTSLRKRLQKGRKQTLVSLLFLGQTGAGKTALVAHLAKTSGFPMVKFIGPDLFVGKSERACCDILMSAFADAYKSPMSVVVLDDLERLLGHVAMGSRFSNVILQTLLVLICRRPPASGTRAPCKLLVLATTSNPQLMADVGLTRGFTRALQVPLLTSVAHVEAVIRHAAPGMKDEAAVSELAKLVPLPMSVRTLQLTIDLACEMEADDGDDDEEGAGILTVAGFMECLSECGVL